MDLIYPGFSNRPTSTVVRVYPQRDGGDMTHPEPGWSNNTDHEQPADKRPRSGATVKKVDADTVEDKSTAKPAAKAAPAKTTAKGK